MGPSNAKWASILLLLSLSKILDSEQLISGVVSRDVAMRRQLATHCIEGTLTVALVTAFIASS